MGDRAYGPDADARKVFVGGLNFTTSREAVYDAFAVCGKVTLVQLVKDPDHPGRSRGYAFVTFDDEDGYRYALNKVAEPQRSPGAVVLGGSAKPS